VGAQHTRGYADYAGDVAVRVVVVDRVGQSPGLATKVGQRMGATKCRTSAISITIYVGVAQARNSKVLSVINKSSPAKPHLCYARFSASDHSVSNFSRHSASKL
jgi:hypothetical protein